MESLTSWGLHTVIDLENCDAQAIRSDLRIEFWVKSLVRIIDMEPYGEPQIIRFGKDDKFGYTCVQLIETSCITAHFAEDTNSAYIDVFSCKPYKPGIVVDHCVNEFGGEITQYKVLNRGA